MPADSRNPVGGGFFHGPRGAVHAGATLRDSLLESRGHRPMITGYNTDVRHGEIVLHVQTEDKGVENPFIESVIYVRGQVLAAKRSGYAQLLEEGKGATEIAAMMEHQHRTILAAIRAGRFDAKLEQVFGARPPESGNGDTILRTSAVDGDKERPVAVEVPAAPPLTTAKIESEEAPEAAADIGPTLDQVILEYLSLEAEHEQLVLSVDGQEEIQPGRVNSLTLRAFSSKTGLPIAGVQVAVRMISTVADPRTLLVTETDDVGSADLQLEVPPYDRGSAALIISGASDLGRAEIKQLL